MPSTPPIAFDHLAVFLAVAETGSFSKAAVRLGVGKGTVSRVIARLEDQLGAEILHRTTHRVALSTAGAELLERTASPMAALQEAVSELFDRGAEPSGELRIAAPHDFGLITLPALLGEFLLRYPRIRADVRLANDKADLVAGGFDVAFRVAMGQQQDSTLTARAEPRPNREAKLGLGEDRDLDARGAGGGQGRRRAAWPGGWGSPVRRGGGCGDAAARRDDRAGRWEQA